MARKEEKIRLPKTFELKALGDAILQVRVTLRTIIRTNQIMLAMDDDDLSPRVATFLRDQIKEAQGVLDLFEGEGE